MTTQDPRPLKVLVLEDDESVREALVDALSVEGFTVDGAGTVNTAIEIVRSGSVDAVLVDVQLADGETAPDFLAKLVDDASAPAMVILSASTRLAIPIGAEFGLPWVRKPCDIDLVSATIRAAVAACRRPRRSVPGA